MLKDLKIGLTGLDNIIDSIYSSVAILNEDRVILRINDEFRKLYGKSEGMKPGNAINCSNLKPKQECGTTTECHACRLAQTFVELKTSGKRYIRKTIDKDIIKNSKKVTLHLRLTLSYIMHNKEKLILLVMDDMTEIINIKDKLYNQNVSLREEIEMAAKLQHSMIPKVGDIDKKIIYKCLYKPSSMLGGDFCDIFKIDEDNIGIYIADVSGHGMKAALLTIFIYSTFNRSLIDPSIALTELFNKYNEYVSDSSMYITVFYAIINTQERQITYANAGHSEPGLLINKESEIIELSEKGLPMCSWIEHTNYSKNSIEYSKDSRLVLFSDGIANSKMKNGKRLGYERTKELISKKIHFKDFPEIMLDSLDSLEDDIAIISIML